VIFVRFVVWSVVAGYNYLLIVIANRRHAPPGPPARPGSCASERERLSSKLPALTTAASPDGQAHGQRTGSAKNQVRQLVKHGLFSSFPHLFKCRLPYMHKEYQIQPCKGDQMNRFADLREKILPLLRPYVKRIAVFGSFARGEETPESDIDLLVELKAPEKRPRLGLGWFSLEEELSRIMGRDVELIAEGSLSPYLRPYAEKDLVLLYEER